MNGPIQITAAQLIIAIVSAAGIGALISTGVSELGRWRERKSRREELLLEKAIVFANWRWEIVKHNANVSKEYIEVSDLIVSTEGYYQLLAKLMKTGKLPEGFKST